MATSELPEHSDRDIPLHEELADQHDEDGWDRAVHGRMLDSARRNPTVEVVTL